MGAFATAIMQFGGTGTFLPMPEISWFLCDQAAWTPAPTLLQGTDPVAEGLRLQGRHAGGSGAQANCPSTSSSKP